MSLDARRAQHIEAFAEIFSREEWTPTDLANYVIQRESVTAANASRAFQESLKPALAAVQRQTLAGVQQELLRIAEEPFLTIEVIVETLEAMAQPLEEAGDES